MSSIAEGDVMAQQASEARDALTTGHTSARNRGVEVTACGKPRRRWTAEQKRQIVAESLEPGASAAMVAARHGISSGQFYAWRQQLLLRGALGAAAETTARSVRGDVTTTAPRPKATIPAPPESDILAAAVVSVRAIALFDGLLSSVFDVLPTSASRLL
jgi:transposase-like protein